MYFPSNDCNLIISTSRNYPYSPHRRDWNFLGVGDGGFCKTHKFKKKLCEALLEFPVGWEVLEKIPSMGEVWIFSGTTQFMQSMIHVCSNSCYIGVYRYLDCIVLAGVLSYCQVLSIDINHAWNN